MNELIVDIIVATALMTIVALAALLLTLRDRFVKGHRKTAAQIRARFSSMLQLRNTLYLCAPGVLVMVLGMFFAIDRGRQHDSDCGKDCSSFLSVGFWFRSWRGGVGNDTSICDDSRIKTTIPLSTSFLNRSGSLRHTKTISTQVDE